MEAFWYLLKPIDEKKLKRVLEKAVLKIENHPQEFIIVSKKRQKKKLFLDNIYYFEVKGRIIYVHGADGILHIMRNLKSWKTACGGKVFSDVIKVIL